MHPTPIAAIFEGSHSVQFFGHEPADQAQLDHLRTNGFIRESHDTLTQQVRELMVVRHPRRTQSEAELDVVIQTYLGGRSLAEYGRWVFYPWSGRLVRVLERNEFREVRLSRNAYKITPEEQSRLESCVIGVVGLSVGNSIARTLALEGVGTLVLADFDSLDLSNLNRLHAGVHELGQNKAVLAARQILELDPYIDVHVLLDGVTEFNVTTFLDGPPKLDLVVEECDSLEVKFLVREQARARRIPVLMETSDRGLVDIERFDQEPARPLLHGLLHGYDWTKLRGLTTEQKVGPVLEILGAGSISARMAASLIEVKRTLATWPQLGSDVTLGGATIACAARRIITGQPLASGRRYVDLADILSTPGVALPCSPDAQSGSSIGRVPSALPSLDENAPPLSGCGSIAIHLIRAAVQAPSAGNCQPWLFQLETDGTIHLVHDRTRSRNLLDADGLASMLAFGAAIENMHLAATHRQGRLQVQPFPRPACDEWVATLRFRPNQLGSLETPDPLFTAIPLRRTNRRNGNFEPLAANEATALESAAIERGAKLQLHSNPETLDAIGAILGEADRIRFLCPDLHREAMQEMRWTAQHAGDSRDGIDLATLDLTESEAAALRVMARPDAIAILRRMNLGTALADRSWKALTGACAVGLLRATGSSPREFLQAGRSLQRVWLSAAQLGIGLQPMGVLFFMRRMLGRPEGDVFNESERHTVRRLSEQLEGIFQANSKSAPAMLFRLVRTPAGSARSLRRSLDSVVRRAREVTSRVDPEVATRASLKV